MDRLQTISERPMLLRQVPLLEGEAVTGYVDLVSAELIATPTPNLPP